MTQTGPVDGMQREKRVETSAAAHCYLLVISSGSGLSTIIAKGIEANGVRPEGGQICSFEFLWERAPSGFF